MNDNIYHYYIIIHGLISYKEEVMALATGIIGLVAGVAALIDSIINFF